MIHKHFSSGANDILDISELGGTSEAPIAASRTMPPSLPPYSFIQNYLPTRALHPSLPPPRLREDLLIEVPNHPPRFHLEERLHHQRRKRLPQQVEGMKMHMPKSNRTQKDT